MRILLRLLRDESGVSLLMAVAVLGVLSTTAASFIAYSNSNARSARYEKRSTSAYNLAEAGINRAFAVLYNSGNWALRPDLLPATTESLEGGTVTWSGTLNQIPLDAPSWAITATATTSNPSGGEKITRTVTATVPVTLTTTGAVENGSWEYVVSTDDDGVAEVDTGDPDDCDMTIGQNTNTGSPIYVFGDLCMESPSSIVGGPGSELYVLGGIDLYGQNVNIGTGAAPVDTMAVGYKCRYWNKPVHQPCRNGAPPGGGGGAVDPGDNVWAQGLGQGFTIGQSVPVLTPPTSEVDTWYEIASPGPHSPCVVSTGVPGNGTGSWATAFDDSSKVRNNNMPLFNLAPPTASYSCVTASGGIDWNHLTGTLAINGSIYIDGGVKIESAGTITYTGQGTVYMSGSFLLRNTKLCAAVSGSNCNWTLGNWDPATTMIVFVAEGTAANGPVQVGDGILIRQAQFQGALWSAYDIELDTSTETQGPMIAPEVVINNTVEARLFPTASIVPFGMPGQTVQHPVVGAPTIIPD